jgi:hypothetical protein
VEGENINLDRFKTLGVIEDIKPKEKSEIDSLFNKMKSLFSKTDFTKSEIVQTMKEYLPYFEHEEKGKNLDQKM